MTLGRPHTPVCGKPVTRLITHSLSILICLVFAGPSSVALQLQKQLTQYVLRNWNEEQGLPHGSVYEILQTRSGYIWTRGLLTLNSNHRMDQTAPYACNKDKFRWVINKSFNVCFVEQPIRGGFRVSPHTPGINMLFKFSENFNTNGGVTIPRIKDAPIVIDVEQQFGTIPGDL